MIMLMEWLVYIALVLFGGALGSFAGASVWRLRARQLVYDQKHGEEVNKKELTKLKPLITELKNDRSHCLACGRSLRWFDMIPVLSWLALRGKCRQCKKHIGWFELLIELGLIAFFIISYILWPTELLGWIEITQFIVWLIIGVVLAMLFAYDAKWYLLPDILNITLVVLGVVFVALSAVQGDAVQTVLSAIGSVGILAGLYWILHVVSRGRWVGFGDVKLGVGLGLILIHWQLALVALFAANFIGCLLVLPLLIIGKLKRQSRVPFGPLLIAGALVAFIFGNQIIDWYTGLFVL